MKVKELIAQLQQYPGEYDVWLPMPPTSQGVQLVPIFFSPTKIYKYRNRESLRVWFDNAVYTDPDYLVLSEQDAVIIQRTY